MYKDDEVRLRHILDAYTEVIKGSHHAILGYL